MAGFNEGVDRRQSALSPDRLDDCIGEDSVVRVVVLFVEDLDLHRPGSRARPPRGQDGQAITLRAAKAVHPWLPPPHPVEPMVGARGGAQCRRHVLTGNLVADHKTIAGFRRDNGVGKHGRSQSP